jgi:hypothetical protein
MAQWTKEDEAAGSPIWSAPKKSPTRAEANLFFGNTTADAYVAGATVGSYGVSKSEINQVVYHIVSATPIDYGDSAYLVGEVLTVANTTAGTGNTHVEANLTITTVEVGTVAVNAGGDNYGNDDTITIESTNGTFSTATVFTVTTGAADTTVASVVATERGSYTVEPTRDGLDTELVVAANGDANGCVLDVTMRMKGLSVTVEGVYTASPNTSDNPVTGGTGTGGELVLGLSGGMSDGKIAGGPGWVKRTVGTGGRAGRIQAEVLVCVSSLEGDAEDIAFPEFPDET